MKKSCRPRSAGDRRSDLLLGADDDELLYTPGSGESVVLQ